MRASAQPAPAKLGQKAKQSVGKAKLSSKEKKQKGEGTGLQMGSPLSSGDLFTANGDTKNKKLLLLRQENKTKSLTDTVYPEVLIGGPCLTSDGLKKIFLSLTV